MQLVFVYSLKVILLDGLLKHIKTLKTLKKGDMKMDWKERLLEFICFWMSLFLAFFIIGIIFFLPVSGIEAMFAVWFLGLVFGFSIALIEAMSFENIVER